ncbi:hypothetical protein V5O48_009118 [Marasmius crinis-equi]|uniref:F-box domain-containing protein n=1 Tax=Marasmius crinis-equi TaxID=585013 RepID=A0ABR3FC32_9AGAR
MVSTENQAEKLYECNGCGLVIASSSTTLQDVLLPAALDAFSKTNQPLPPVEFGNVSEECSHLSDEISSLEDRISRLKASMKNLQQEKERLEARLQTYKPLIHPIRRLPDDVISYIFRICGDMDVEDPQKNTSNYYQRYPGSLDTRKAPWLLGQICRKWRALLASLPQLWTVVDLDWRYEGPLREYHPAMDMLLSTQLQRCRDQELTISYCGLEPLDPGNPLTSNVRLLLILCSRSFQWSKATIRADADGLLALSSYRGMFPNLHDLHLHFLNPVKPGWIRAHDRGTVFDAFHETPSLRKLTLTGYMDAIRDLSIRFPWPQITHYSVHNDLNWFADLNDHFPILQQMKNLQYCSLETNIPSTAALNAPESPIRLPHLHTLILSHRQVDSEESAIDPLLNSLTLPSLRILRLTCGLDSSSALLSFLRRSTCTSLEQLAVLRSVLDDDALVRLLQVGGAEFFGNVHTLELGGTSPLDLVNISDEVIRALTIPSEPNTATTLLVPKLRCLILYDEKVWSDSVFVDMLQSRRDVGRFGASGKVSRLERLILQDAVAEGERVIKDLEVARRLEALCREGLEVEVRWTSGEEEDVVY